jgi:hypothetical protein
MVNVLVKGAISAERKVGVRCDETVRWSGIARNAVAGCVTRGRSRERRIGFIMGETKDVEVVVQVGRGESESLGRGREKWGEVTAEDMCRNWGASQGRG